MLVILVGLDGDASQGCVRPDGLRGTQHAMAGGEPVLEQVGEVDLAAGGCQSKKVEVVDVDVTVTVGGGVGRVEHLQ